MVFGYAIHQTYKASPTTPNTTSFRPSSRVCSIGATQRRDVAGAVQSAIAKWMFISMPHKLNMGITIS
jgi:hypothetical protein